MLPDFKDRLASLDQARKQSKQSQQELFAFQQRQAKILRMRDALQRGAGGESNNVRINELNRMIEELTRSINTLQARVQSHSQLVIDELAAFLPFSDPIQNISRLDDTYPILLFPVRIETRFKELSRGHETVHQLWVRVYPDDIAVDTFEEMLAEVEVHNARIYWTNIWKAGGVESEKRAAWQSLVKSHGPGRAYWIIQQVKPLNLAEEPKKAVGELILVIVTENPLLGTEKQWVEQYWQEVWLANNDPAKIDAALTKLIQNLGQDRANIINSEYRPQNLDKAQVSDKSTITKVSVKFLEMPKAEEFETQQQPWMHAARATIMPERFVLLGFNGDQETLRVIGNPIPSDLVVGPSPSAPPDQQIRLEGDELVIPAEIKWMVDFDEAVKNGMGFRVNLSATQARLGFDKLFILGIRLSADITKSREQLETLIAHHQKSRKGLSLLPQGTPTNNVEDEPSGYTWRHDSDISYDHYFKQDPSDDPADWHVKKDGRWLAEYLGVDPDVLKTSPNYYATDQKEARAMNVALWPATLGNFMQELMEPVFSDATIEMTREFFNRYVIGRGTIPAIRVGNQPYGILPATPFTHMKWLRRDRREEDRGDMANLYVFLPRLHDLLLKANETWSTLKNKVSYVGKPSTNPQQVLLDVIGLHPSSVEFYQRYAETLEQLYNRLKYSGLLNDLVAAVVGLTYVNSGLDLLRTLGYDTDTSEIPEILNKFFLQTANLLKGPLIDDRPLSETERIRAYRDDKTNYIEWLIKAARDSHNTLRMQAGFMDNRPPNALLYLMLQHALDLGYLETSFQLHLNAGVFSPEQFRKARKQPKFIHIQDPQEDAGSLWQYLYKTEPAITNSQTRTIADYIPQILASLNPYLNQQITALEYLKDVPTARLERAFVEHLDCCSYRLDAWWLGLVNIQLEAMRNARTDQNSETSRGSYLGAYGWLEDVRPEHKHLEAVRLNEELDKIFNKAGQPPLMRDDSNFGYIHAPSLNHAVTAAVLRNGYLSNATPQNPESLSINLTSERVRIAMSMIEGIRNGQSLAALLGYEFERGLHNQPNLFLDSVILEFRKHFPLVGNHLSTTKTEEDVSIEFIEARNVVNGLALIEHVQAQTKVNQTYPFGLGSKLPKITDANKLKAINSQVQRIMNISDAVADLAMAESVYQVVQGNYERTAGNLDAFSKGNFPPTPEVIQTPRSGVILTHRIGLHFIGGLDPHDASNITPHSKGEPAVNRWLKDYLPDSDDVFCEVEFFDHSVNTLRTETVTQAQLGLLPIDLLYILNLDGQHQMTALDDRILSYVLDTFNPRPDSEIQIRYRVKRGGKFSFFELATYLANLRTLILRSRPLRPTDIKRPNEADKSEEFTGKINESKITIVKDLLISQSTSLNTLLTDLEAVLGNSDLNIVSTNAIDNIDLIIFRYRQIADQIARFGLPGAALAFTYDWRRKQFADLITKLDDFVNRWNAKLAEFDQGIIDYAALDPTTSNQEKFNYLLRIGQLIWTAALTPLPVNPDQLRDDLNMNKRSAFVTVLNDLRNILNNSNEVSKLYKDITSKATDIAKHDLQKIDLEENKSAIVAFAHEIKAKTQSLSADIGARLTKSNALLTGNPSANAAKRISELTEAARQLLGPDFVILPEFSLPADQRAEWQNAWDNEDQLLKYLKNEEMIDFPIDDWLYGAARVREKLHHLESAIMLSNAIKNKDLELHPLQFPFHEHDSWLGLRFPKTRPEYVFSVELAFASELDTGGLVSSELHTEFQTYGNPLSAKAEITVQQAGSQWVIIDPSGEYRIASNGTALKVYKLISVINEDKLLYTAHYHKGFDSTDPLFCGVLIDEWTEIIPTTEETTGLTYHYDRPNTEPPQTLLLVTPSNFNGQWQWQDLVDTLHDTLDLAKKRAVEPQHIASTAYSRFLPAVLSEAAIWPITAALNFAFNNDLQFKLEQ